MTERRIRFALSTLLAALVLLVVGVAWHLLGPGIGERNFDSIALGMSNEEVNRILGGPPRDEPGHDPYLAFYLGAPAGSRYEFWRAAKCGVAVCFDANG